MKKRIGAFGLVIAMLLTLACPALAADTTFVIKGPSTSPKAGETFTVTVELTGNPGFNAIGFTLIYDKNKMTCTSAKEGDRMQGMLSVTNPNASTGAIVTGASVEAKTGDGAVGRFTFTAKTDLTELKFGLSDIVLSDAEGKSISYQIVTAAESGNPDNPGTGTGTGSTPGGQTPVPTPSNPGGGQTTDPTPTDPGGGQAADPQPGETVGFTDTKGHWGESYILKAADLGLFKGYTDGSFKPDQNVTRAQYVTVLYRMAGSPSVTAASPFTDIGDQIAEFQNAIAWGYEKGFINGKGATTFDPGGYVTRQEAMKILFGYDGGVSGMETMFTAIYDANYTDSDKLASWAKAGMYWGVYHTIISGTSATTLSPQGTATRAQLAKILTVYDEMKKA